MKKIILLGMLFLLTGAVASLQAAPKDEVVAAAKKLGSSANYSWDTTVKVPEGSRFRPGPSEGKTEKDGLTWAKMSFGPNPIEVVFKGDKGAVKTADAGWQSLEELNSSEGPGRFLGAVIHNFKSPAVQAAELAEGVKDLKKDGEAFAGDLTEDGAKQLLAFRGRNGDGPTVSGAKGSAKFWIKDGLLTKAEYQVSGKVTFNGNERDVDRTTTIEIKDLGKTKVEVPEEAKKKMEPAAAKSVGESKTNSPAPAKK